MINYQFCRCSLVLVLIYHMCSVVSTTNVKIFSTHEAGRPSVPSDWVARLGGARFTKQSDPRVWLV